jgi:hypothetical protein
MWEITDSKDSIISYKDQYLNIARVTIKKRLKNVEEFINAKKGKESWLNIWMKLT